MTAPIFGILHPGAMGASIAAAIRKAGHDCFWAPEGRGPATAQRAAEQGLTGANLGEMCRTVDIILSVCPPHAALDVARDAAAAGFRGVYVDANAVSPDRAREVAGIVTAGGADYVDGGIVGPPAWKPGTCLYLSGRRAAEVAAFVDGPILEAQALDEKPDTASALKMVYAARTKGVTALLAAIWAAADALGVRGHLETRLAGETEGLPAQVARQIQLAGPKAWRWIAEMEEIAATLRAAGSEGGFHDAAARLYARLDGFKDAEDPALDDLLDAVRAPAPAKAAE